MEQPTQRESATRTYLHFLAYALPGFGFLIFTNLVLLPRIDVIWDQAGEPAAKAEWVLNLCKSFTSYFYFVTPPLILSFVLLEKFWPRWQTLRRSVIRATTWILNFFLMTVITWVSVSACLAVPMVLPKSGESARFPGDSK